MRTLRTGTAFILVSTATLCAGAPAWAADPLKDAPKRHGYDFTQPEPAEILPNPKTGVGTPPALQEYVTAHAMSDEGGQSSAAPPKPATVTETTDASTGAGSPTPPGAASNAPPTAKQGRERPPKTAAAPPPRSAPPNDAAASPPTPQISGYVRISLAEQVASKGAAGPFTYRPSAAAQADAAVRGTEQAAWSRVTTALAQSWRAWETAHPPARTTRPSTAAPSAVQASPGRLVLSGAPPSVTGDFPAEPADVAVHRSSPEP